MMIRFITMLSEILLYLEIIHIARSACPTFGNDKISRLERSNNRKIFMNFESPAQCPGNVTSWRFCYYRNLDNRFEAISNNREFSALFVVYRRHNDTYIPVPGSVREKKIEWEVVRESSFHCTNETLQPSEYFEIQENDIVGACIKDTGDVDPLLIVGTSSESNYYTYQWDRPNFENCLNSQYYDVDSSHKDFKLRSTSVLHLYANIVASDSDMVGSPTASAAAITSGFSGTYLNVGFPVTGKNHITKWHYCYYPQATTPGSVLSMKVAVWSLDVASNTYIVNPRSIRFITLTAVQTLAKIFCVQEPINQTEYVSVSHGDVIGLSLHSANAIPIVGSSSLNSTTLLKVNTEKDFPSDMSEADLMTMTTRTLHLHATLEKIDVISTEEFVSVTSDFEAKKIFNLLFLPIVIVAALMFIAAVTAVFIILAMVLKKRNNKVYSQDGYGNKHMSSRNQDLSNCYEGTELNSYHLAQDTIPANIDGVNETFNSNTIHAERNIAYHMRSINIHKSSEHYHAIKKT